MERAAIGAFSSTLPRKVRIDSRRRYVPDLAELWRYRELVWLFGRRDLTVRYRQTIFGTLWVFAGPLVTALLFTFVFGEVADLPTDGVPYFVFSYAGLLAWNLFTGVLTGASTSLTSNSGLITKVYFPRLVIPLATMAGTLVNTLISFGVMLFLLLVSGVGYSVEMVSLPLWLLLAVALAIGVSLTVTSLSVSYRDVNYVTPLITQVLLWLSPVAYSLEAVPANLRDLYLLNPLTSIVEGCRWALLGGDRLPPAWAIAYTVAVTVAVLVVGLVVFSRREVVFADVV
jgi:lipopolysaccharide transport system permease protein